MRSHNSHYVTRYCYLFVQIKYVFPFMFYNHYVGLWVRNGIVAKYSEFIQFNTGWWRNIESVLISLNIRYSLSGCSVWVEIYAIK